MHACINMCISMAACAWIHVDVHGGGYIPTSCPATGKVCSCSLQHQCAYNSDHRLPLYLWYSVRDLSNSTRSAILPTKIHTVFVRIEAGLKTLWNKIDTRASIWTNTYGIYSRTVNSRQSTTMCVCVCVCACFQKIWWIIIMFGG